MIYNFNNKSYVLPKFFKDVKENEFLFYLGIYKDVVKFYKEQGWNVQALNKNILPALFLVRKLKGESNVFVDICTKLHGMSSALTKERFLLMYGDNEGSKRWDSYCNLQRITNSQEYKGMTDEEFKEYNRRRAVTLENLQRKYGKETGSIKFDKYREKQSYTKSLEYFCEKYGKEKGLKEYKRINTLKTRPKSKNSSRIAIEFFTELENYFPNNKFMYYPKTDEYMLYGERSLYFYDFVDPVINLCIEFNGDIFHGNPRIFKEDDTPNPFKKSLTAKNMWEMDKIKLKAIEKNGFMTVVVWESDYRLNKQKTISDIVNLIKIIYNN